MNRIVKRPARGAAVAMAMASAMVLVSAATTAAEPAHPGVSLNAARVGAKDAASIAKFYETAFGWKSDPAG